MTSDAHSKVQAQHLKRNAYLYVRQSSLRQVFENTESTKRQYDLRQRAIALGWQVDQVVVIDSDQGQSGKFSADREGFQRLVTEVGLGRAGIVMGLEVSRLARNSSDWHRLLEICALTDTLVLDDDGLYDPAHFNDRLLLGLKGTMSEAELHVVEIECAAAAGRTRSRSRSGPPEFSSIAASKQQSGKKRINGPPPQPSLPAERRAILDLITQSHQRCPYCRRSIIKRQRRS